MSLFIRRTQTPHWHQHCYQDSRTLRHLSNKVMLFPSFGIILHTATLCTADLDSGLLTSGDELVCLPQVLQGADSGDGPEARSWVPVRHPGSFLAGERQHHDLRTGGLIISRALWSIFSDFIHLEGNWGTFWLLPVGGALWKGHGMHEDGTEHRLRCWHVSYQPLRVLPHLPHQGECGALWVLDRLDSVTSFSRDVASLLTTQHC